MAFKFPFTNYHELNLTWVLDQLKALFEKSEENVTVIENYNGRLTAVETELPLVAETAQGASQQAAAAATLAQTASEKADTAQENAIQAQGLAGTARQEAQAAQTAADAATQAAQQAQATAQNFDGRITQAKNDSAAALEASRSFENRVQAAITTANNAAQTATNAQGIATRADQNAALALDTLNAQRSELERIGREQAALITEETESGKTEIEQLAQSVLDSIPTDYTALSALVDKKAPVIINSASGSIASFDDGADDMKIQKLVVNIEPVQAGSGDPSPDNVRPIIGWTGVSATRTGKNMLDIAAVFNNIGSYSADGSLYTLDSIGSRPIIQFAESDGNYILTWDQTAYGGTATGVRLEFYNSENTLIAVRYCSDTTPYPVNGVCKVQLNFGNNGSVSIKNVMLRLDTETDATFAPYQGNIISVTFPSSAGNNGTVYGGTLDVISGKLTINRVGMKFENVTTDNVAVWGSSGSVVNSCRINLDPLAPFITGPESLRVMLCNVLPTELNSSVYTGAKQGVSTHNSGHCGIHLDGATTVQEYIDFINNNDFFLSWELATSQEVQLTPQEVKTLLGVNNIWADTGPVSVDYPADTKLYIDGKFAELQATILENI